MQPQIIYSIDYVVFKVTCMHALLTADSAALRELMWLLFELHLLVVRDTCGKAERGTMHVWTGLKMQCTVDPAFPLRAVDSE